MSDGEPLATAPPLVAAAREMRPRERLIWADRPAAGTSLRETARGVLFGLGFAAFAAVWSGFAFILTLGNASAPFKWFPYFGIPFFLAGLLIAGGALFRLPVLGSRLYALSAERFLVLSDRPSYRVRAIDLATITGVERNERRDGSGTLILGLEGGRQSKLAGVPEVGRVAAEIERLRRKTGSR